MLSADAPVELCSSPPADVDAFDAGEACNLHVPDVSCSDVANSYAESPNEQPENEACKLEVVQSSGLDISDGVAPIDALPGAASEESQNWSSTKSDGSNSRSPSKLKARVDKFEGEGAECAICFAPLPTEPVCVLIANAYGQRRSCRHYFHQGCVRLLQKSTPAPHTCPLCRAVFERTEPLQDVRLDSAGWFRLVDADERGALEKWEVVDALSATLPVDPALLATALDGDLWKQWDVDGTGRITREDFDNPSQGLLRFVLYTLPSLRREQKSSAPSVSIPDIISCREGWFRYWDEGSNLVLEFTDFLRALVRTLRLEGRREDAGMLRSVLTSVWQEFGLEEAGQADDAICQRRPVTLKLFCERPDGFCDVLTDALRKNFGAERFHEIHQRALLLQKPVAELKRELRKYNVSHIDAIEKDDLVAAILRAQNAKEVVPEKTVVQNDAPPPPSQTPVDHRREALRTLPVSELQRHLRALGVPYGHCVEREELEDLLLRAHHRRPQAAASSSARPGPSSPAWAPREAPTTRPESTRCSAKLQRCALWFCIGNTGQS